MRQQTTIYLVRHGETEYNRRRIVQGRRIDCPLNETGETQARLLAERFRDVPLDAIYASPLRRARRTAEIVASGHPEAPVKLSPDLEEMSWGIYEGEGLTASVREMLAAAAGEWQQGRFDRPVEGGESILDVQRRGLRIFERMAADHPGETLLAVTHGRFLRVLLATVLEEYGLTRMHEIHHANTGVNRLVLEAGRCRADLLNCTAHLAALEVQEGIE